MHRIPLSLAAAALLTVSACGAGEVTADPSPTDTSVEESPTTSPTSTSPPPSTTTTATPTPTTTSEPTDTAAPPEEGGEATLEYVTLRVPAGWELQDMGGFQYGGGVQPTDPLPPHEWCLAPPDAGVALFGCAGVSIVVGGDWLPGHNGQDFTENQAHGWYAAAPPVLCPFDAEAGGDDPNHLSTAGDGAPVHQATVQVGGEDALEYQWEASCERGEQRFTPQAWHLPEGQVLVKDYLGHEETGSILESLQVEPF